MKRFLISVCFAALFVFVAGCKKDKGASPSSIEGLWELRQVSGMFIITYPQGNGNTIHFQGDSYQMYSNGQLIQSGDYKIEEDLSVQSATCLVIPQGQYTNRIIYDNNTSQKVFIQISGNKLSFISGCFAYDAGSSKDYERQ